MGPSLSPAVSGARHFVRERFIPHVIGGMIGGLIAGLIAAGAAGLVNLLPAQDIVVPVAVAAILVCTLGETLPTSLLWPSTTRQVYRNLQRTTYPRTTAFVWGVDLGFGWSTRQATSALLATTIAAVAVGPETALLAGLLFGMVRSLTLLLGLQAQHVQDVERRFDWMRKHPLVPRSLSAKLV